MDEVWEKIKEDYTAKVKEITMRAQVEPLVPLLLSFSQIILTGPPGTSKTYLAKRLAAKLLGIPLGEVEKEEKGEGGKFTEASFRVGDGEVTAEGDTHAQGAWALVQFHPAYNYEDFVRGIQVRTEDTASRSQIEYRTVHRLLSNMAREA